MTAMAPTKAAMTRAMPPLSPTVAILTLPPVSSMTTATPTPAPPLMPNTSGPARGLRNTVCMISPAVARPAPLSVAAMAWGRRDSRMMKRHAWGSP